jgi:hypothetical protein
MAFYIGIHEITRGDIIEFKGWAPMAFPFEGAEQIDGDGHELKEHLVNFKPCYCDEYARDARENGEEWPPVK